MYRNKRREGMRIIGGLDMAQHNNNVNSDVTDICTDELLCFIEWCTS